MNQMLPQELLLDRGAERDKIGRDAKFALLTALIEAGDTKVQSKVETYNLYRGRVRSDWILSYLDQIMNYARIFLLNLYYFWWRPERKPGRIINLDAYIFLALKSILFFTTNVLIEPKEKRTFINK